MNRHHLQDALYDVLMTEPVSSFDPPLALFKTSDGHNIGVEPTTSLPANTYAPGALINSNGVPGSNSGTYASPVFTSFASLAAGGTLNAITPSGGTLAVTGILTVSGALTAASADFAGALVAAAGNAFSVNGTTGALTCVGVNYGSGSLVGTGNININSVFTVNGTTGAVVGASLTGLSSGHFVMVSGGTAKNMTIDASTSGTLDLATTSTGNVTIGNGSVSQIGLVGTTIAVTGNLTVSGTITGTYSVSSLSAPALTFTGTVAGANTAITCTGDNVTSGIVLLLSGDALTLGKFLSTDLGGSEKYSVGFDGRTTISGTGGANVFTVTAGDLVVSDGSLTITDADNATTFSLTNNTITSGTLATLAASAEITGMGWYLNFAGLTTGKAQSIAVPAMTEGVGLYISAVEAVLTTGLYIGCFDGAAYDFSVAKYGATVIAGNAGGTAALTLTTGDVTLSSGRLNITSTTDIANSLVRSVAAAGTAAVLTIQASNAASMNNLLFLNQDGTGEATTVLIDSEGTGDCVTITSLAAAASLIKATAEAATGTVFEAISAASSTVSAMNFANSGTGATGWLGAQNVGMLHLVCDGNLAHAQASTLYIGYSGTGAATGLGTSLRIVDTGATASSYAVYISAATGEALNIAVGKSVFAEQISVTAMLFATSGMTITEDATNVNFDAGAANENINFGGTTATDVIFHGNDAGYDCSWIAATDTMTFAAGAQLVVTGGSGAGFVGTGLVIPSGDGAPDGTVVGSLYFEKDAKKIWIRNTAGWEGAVVV